MLELDAKAFRETLGLFATGVAVIATELNGRVHAMTVNAVSSISLEPPLVLFCPGKQTRFSQLLPNAERFSINFLRYEQESVSNYFAGRQPNSPAPHFRFVTSDGIPRLEGSMASLLGTKHRVYDGGDHWLVTVHVRQLHRGLPPHRPLVFFRGEYRQLDGKGGTAAPDLVATADEPPQMYYHP